MILKAVLPNNAGGNNSSNGWTIDKTATSKFDPTQKKTVTDKLTTITLNSVDLAHVNTATGLGTGAGPGATVIKDRGIDPGTSVTFTLYVNNTGTSSDGYTLSASTANTLGSTTLPAGWTVDFKADATVSGAACSTTGSSITSTPTVNALASYTVCAVVTVPANYVAGVQDLYFYAASPTSGKSDGLHDSVTVYAVRSLSLTPNGNGQTYPGGTFLYSHTLKNNGNVDEAVTVSFPAVVSTLTQALVNSDTNWSATVYVSTNATFGDSDDKLVTAATLNRLPGCRLGARPVGHVARQCAGPQGALAGCDQHHDADDHDHQRFVHHDGAGHGDVDRCHHGDLRQPEPGQEAGTGQHLRRQRRGRHLRHESCRMPSRVNACCTRSR